MNPDDVGRSRRYNRRVAILPIRTFGDPVLRDPGAEITEVDDALRRLADDMLETMYDAPGVGLAGQQVGVRRRIFVYDCGDGPGVVLNPEIVETSGEWSYEEGCLSVPDLRFEIVRPRFVHLRGVDLDGNDLDLEMDELTARCFQHETDHLNGILLLERLDQDVRKEALGILRRRSLAEDVFSAHGDHDHHH
jgi:peptide deformylase